MSNGYSYNAMDLADKVRLAERVAAACHASLTPKQIAMYTIELMLSQQQASAGPACDALTWQPISDIGPMPTPHIILGPGLLTAYMKHSGQWYRIDLPEHPPLPATSEGGK